MTPFDTPSTLAALHLLGAPQLPERLGRDALRALRRAVRGLPAGAAQALLHNLVRGLPLVRGFACASRRAAHPHGAHAWEGLARALTGAREQLSGPLAAFLDGALVEWLDTLLQDGLRLAHLHAACLAHDAGHRPMVRRLIGLAMRETPQGRQSDAWRHGRSAEQWYRLFGAWLNQGLRPARYLQSSWPVRLPAWFEHYREALRSAQQPLGHVQQYLLWHDCGKPWALEREAQGALHYPEHARLSALTWCAFAEGSERNVVAELIEHDMCAHRWTAQDLDWLRGSPLGPTLLVAALAELHCNATLFGGIDSESFRIKASRLERRGRQLCEHWFGAAA